MDAYRIITRKRDLRSYADRPIPDDVLRRILDAGRRAGSARNRQPWEFVVITDPALRRRLAAAGRFAAHLPAAPVVVAIVVESERDLFDAGRCAQSMMLGAWALGVASCPATLHDQAAAREALGVPADRVIATVVAFGYPHPRGRGPLEAAALRILAGRGRRPLDSMVSWNRYGNRTPPSRMGGRPPAAGPGADAPG